jgi:predicted nucleotidyltransferase
MSSGPTKRALEVAEQETAELVDAGAQAVILTGSHARGDAHAESDLDLRVIGDGPPEALKRHEEFLVSISWQELEKHREDLEDPSAVGTVVPGWRTCVIIHDPDGLAAKLKAEAEEWDWDRIAEKSDEWVAHEVTDFAEEVHTLIGNLDMDQLSGAAAIRSQLAMNLAQVGSRWGRDGKGVRGRARAGARRQGSVSQGELRCDPRALRNRRCRSARFAK